MNIYFICTGNTCRSPLAEAIVNHADVSGVQAKSAGIHAMDGMPISVNSAQLLREADMAYKKFSNELKRSDMQWADIILTMTKSHRDFLHGAFPEMKEKVFTLKEYRGTSYNLDVHDPYGGDLSTYRTTFNELTELIYPMIQQLAEEKR
ncbi:low molecular weight protein arginine phosphatase [Sporosarcina sp. PTS2304]|uniref:low molecular weight protein arginine phosphatase n=1 Tax=Sporosarcina sp. PTS2304 TaxID=2283194 RepID=UPI000E0D2DA7|nr:low molecular weight protein arginine phosphatase [Sporosarcina sp. PTS2304]AXI01128.1 low molecular weight protein arginine phosphatase [Sporosarcina sp. PTS2304]